MTDKQLIKVLEEHGMKLVRQIGELRVWSNGSFSIINDFGGKRWRFCKHGNYGPSQTMAEMLKWFEDIDEAIEGKKDK